MLSKVFHLMKKKNKAPALDKRHMDIDCFMKYIADLLNIELPEIRSFACIFQSNGLIQSQIEFKREQLPADASYIGAFYMDDRNLIITSRKHEIVDFRDGSIHFRNKTAAEKLFEITHELRHVWQKTYHEDLYYKKNAVELEVVQDIAEIDADGFALAYVFSDRTPFSYEDFPNMSEEIVLQATVDGGARFKRATEIAEEYGFVVGTAWDDLRECVDKEQLEWLAKVIGAEL